MLGQKASSSVFVVKNLTYRHRYMYSTTSSSSTSTSSSSSTTSGTYIGDGKTKFNFLIR